MEWVKEELTNSCDVNLVKRIDKKFDCLAEYEQGGITYLKIALDEADVYNEQHGDYVVAALPEALCAGQDCKGS